MMTRSWKCGGLVPLWLFLNLAGGSVVQALTVTNTYEASGTFIVPSGVTNLTVEAWGGGGGARNDSTSRYGGGGGGAYARSMLDVAPGATYAVTVGQGGAPASTLGGAGGDSWFGNVTQLLAKGGSGSSTNGGAGGTAAASIGTVRYSGGTGGGRGTSSGGGGGGSAYANANGGNGAAGSGSTGGAGGTGAGDGGKGGNSGQPGQNGTAPGGGGGGRGTDGGTSGSGANGRVQVAYALQGGSPGQLAILGLPEWTYKDANVAVTVELQDTNGLATVAAITTTVQLATSQSGVFRNLEDTQTITFVTIAPGQCAAGFLYRPTRSGAHTLVIEDEAGVLAPDSGTLQVRQFPVPVQTFYLPLPADHLLQALNSLHGGLTWLASSWRPVSPIWNYVVITVSSDDTIIYYDQMENGYEESIRNPTNIYDAVSNPSGTQVWGDGNPLNGHPPGTVDDIINGQTTIVLSNAVPVPGAPDPNNPLVRAGDKFAASKAIAITWAGWASQAMTMLAGALEIYDVASWGTDYRVPVGQNIPDNVDYQMFEYAGAAIMAGESGAEVQIDLDNNGTWDQSVILGEGESHLVDGGLSAGARIVSDHPVQVDLITGDRQDGYESRFCRLLPARLWTHSYYTPVSTPSSSPQDSGTSGTDTTVWLFNPNTSAIEVTYARRGQTNLTSDVANQTVGYPSQPLPGTLLGNVYGPIRELNSDGTYPGTPPPGAWIGIVNRSAGNSPSIASKVANAQTAGASGVIIVNNTGGTTFPTETAGTGRVFPVVGMTQNDGAAMRAAGLGAGWLRVSGDQETSTLTVPASGYAKQVLTNGCGGHFYTVDEEAFYALSTTDSTGTQLSNNSAGQNRTFDWGFTLVPRSSLTPHLLVGLGIGRDPTSSVNPNENGSPIWVTTVGNGNSNTAVYVDYDADPTTGAFVDPSGYRYDLALTLRELELVKVFNPSGDQTGILVYTLEPGVRLAAAWGGDVLTASTSEPGLDMGTGIPPLPEFYATKRSVLWFDNDTDGFISPGDHLEYEIEIFNISRVPVDEVRVEDNLPDSVDYLPESTVFIDENGGTNAIPDNPSGSPFPLDNGGYLLPYPSLAPGHGWKVQYRVVIKTFEELPENTDVVVNSAVVTSISVSDPIFINQEDSLNGRIGNYVWLDTDTDGIQDAGETGFEGVGVSLYNSEGGWLASTTTDGNGWYQFVGILSGDYQVQFTPPTGYLFSPQNADNEGLRGELNSDANPATGRTDTFTLEPGESLLAVHAGVWPGADLEVSKTAFQRVVQEEGQAVFTVAVSNRGAWSAGDIVVEDILPAGLNYQTHLTSQGTYSPTSGLWNVGYLEMGAVATLQLTAQVDSETMDTAITNTAAVVNADRSDPNLDNNDASAVVTVSALRLTKESSAPDYISVGDTVTYTVEARNVGSQVQTDIVLTDFLPAGLNVVPDSLSITLVPATGVGVTIPPGRGGLLSLIEENGTNYYVHAYANEGSFTFTPPPEISSVEVLVVGGGGGGAGSTGTSGRGGGGAGGLVYTQSFAVTPRAYAVVVGAGGAGGSAGGQSGFNGVNSEFDTLVARGGGGGGNVFQDGNNGGSGGGAGVNNSGYSGGIGLQPGSPSGGYGHDGGGPGLYQTGSGGGGGGGGGAPGGDGDDDTGGLGGAGLEFAQFGSLAGFPAGWFGGGGGGSASISSGDGGFGGGGDGGSDTQNAASGQPNTGGGGGGAQSGSGGNGGTGIVLIRYPAGQAGDATMDYSSSGTFTVPSGVTNIVVETWGGGGKGGTRTTSGAGGGGGGGAYSRRTVTVTPGQTHYINVGAGSSTTSAGGDSWYSTNSFVSGALVLAAGGYSVANNSASGAAGGSAAAGIGDVRFSGGSGANGSSGSYGGGGGSSAGTAAEGADGSGRYGGDAPDGGGDGGNGRSGSQGSGSSGLVPGGGGGGGLRTYSYTRYGGNGANGRVRIRYVNPAPRGDMNAFPDFATGWQLVPGQLMRATFQVQVADLMGRTAITNFVSIVSADYPEPLVAWTVNETVLIPPDVLEYAVTDSAGISNQVTDRSLAAGEVDVQFTVYHPAGVVLAGATFDLLTSNGVPVQSDVALDSMETIEFNGYACQRLAGRARRTFPALPGLGRVQLTVQTTSGAWLQDETHCGPHPMEYTVHDNDVVPPEAMPALNLNGQPAPPPEADRDVVQWTCSPEFLLDFAAVTDPPGGDELPLQQRESSGIGEYRITSLSVTGLTPAARALVGAACPGVAEDGALANRGFENDIAGMDWEMNAYCTIQTRTPDPELVYAGERSLRQASGGQAVQTLMFRNESAVIAQVTLAGRIRGGPANLSVSAYAADDRDSPLGTVSWSQTHTTNDWTSFSVPNQVLGNALAQVITVTLTGQGPETWWDDLELSMDVQTNAVTLRYLADSESQGAVLTAYAVDDDFNRSGDRLAGDGRRFRLPFDITPPTPVNMGPGGSGATTDTVDDPTTQFDLTWSTAGVGPDDPASSVHPTRQPGDTDLLSCWESYKIYYGIYYPDDVPPDDDPSSTNGYIYRAFITNSSYRSWKSVTSTNPIADPTAATYQPDYSTLTNMATAGIRLYDLDYDQDYVVVVVGVDKAGNEGSAGVQSWATNNTIRFALIRGEIMPKNKALQHFPAAPTLSNPNANKASALYWLASGATNELGEYTAVWKDYDLLWWDGARFKESPTNQWQLAGTVRTNWFVDDGSQNRNRGKIRFYRASYGHRWKRTNEWGQSQRPLASEEVYSQHNVVLSGGQNFVALHGTPYLHTFRAVFGGLDIFPGGQSALPDSGATVVEFYSSGSNTITTLQYYLNDNNRWMQVGGDDVTDIIQPPEFFTRGFSITLPTPLPTNYATITAVDINELDLAGNPVQVPAMVWSPVVQVPTNGFSQVIFTGEQTGRGGTVVFNVAALRLPVAAHPGEMRLLESGFVKGPRGLSDEIYTMNTATKGVLANSTIYCDPDGVWRYVAGNGLVPGGFFKPNDVIVIVSRNGGLGNEWTWTYHPTNFYALPTRWMGN